MRNQKLFESDNAFEIKHLENLFITPMEHFIDIDNLSQFNIAKILYKDNPL